MNWPGNWAWRDCGGKKSCLVRLVQRIKGLVGDDMGALLPGSGVPLNARSGLRLLLYLGLALFTVQLLLPERFLLIPGPRGPGRTFKKGVPHDAPLSPERRHLPETLPEPAPEKSPKKDNITDPRSI